MAVKARGNEALMIQNLHGQRPQQHVDKLQQELQSVNQQLMQMTRARKSTDESDLEHNLLDKSILLQLKLKRWKEVVEEGYKILGKKGPSVIVYKCILVGLCRLGRYDEEVSDLLDVWWKATPKCGQMLQCREKMNYYLNAIKSGLEPTELFRNLEDALGLNADWVGSGEKYTNKIENGISTESNPNNITKMAEQKHHWKFRPPASTDAPYYLCPRGGNSCMYGDTCVAAHSKEELEEWIQRRSNSGNSNKYIEERPAIPTSAKKPSEINPKLSDLSSTVNLLKELPSFAFHYLVEINKRIKEAQDIRSLFAEDLPNVKFLCKSPLNIVKKVPIADLGTSCVETTWIFVLSTKSPMRNVCLLEDCHRECFRISTGKFVDASKTTVNLIDLHDMNALQNSKSVNSFGVQVLNSFIPLPILYQIAGNWPDWFFYKIEVTFRQPPLKYGTFVQSVMFDMKHDPKLIKHLTIQVVPEESKQMNNVANSKESNGYDAAVYYQLFSSGPGQESSEMQTQIVENIATSNRKSVSDENCNNLETNDFKSKYGSHAINNATAVQKPGTSTIYGFANGSINAHMQSPPIANSNSTYRGIVAQNCVPRKYSEDTVAKFEGNMEHKIIKAKVKAPQYNLYNGSTQPKNPYNNICKDLNPSQFMSHSQQANKPSIKETDSMPSLYEQNVKYTFVNQGSSGSLRGSTLSSRSESPSSSSTISSNSSSGDYNHMKATNNGTDFPDLATKKSQKESEWLKVQKSNKKTKYVPENQEFSEDESNPPGLSTETKIGFLQEMGFDRRSAIKALQFCNKDLERSVEWLISGEEKRHSYNKQGK